MAVLLHVTPAMPRKFRGDWSCSYFYGRSLFAADLCREVSYTDETMCTRSEGLSMSRNSVDMLTDLTVV